MDASEHGHTEVVKLLLSKGADPKKVTTVSRITSGRVTIICTYINYCFACTCTDTVKGRQILRFSLRYMIVCVHVHV